MILSITNLDLMTFFEEKNLPRIKNGANVINLDDKNSKGTYWVSLLIALQLYIYFEFFAEYI